MLAVVSLLQIKVFFLHVRNETIARCLAKSGVLVYVNLRGDRSTLECVFGLIVYNQAVVYKRQRFFKEVVHVIIRRDPGKGYL